MMEPLQSIEDYISAVRSAHQGWNTVNFPWFRGEPGDTKTPLLPSIFREKNDSTFHDDNQLLQFFRMKVPSLGLGSIPPRSGHTDQWLFLARHVGLPTRLLDWSEGALVALYFALQEREPIVWMLNPVELNRMSFPIGDNEFPLTWVIPEDGSPHPGSENFRCAWEHERRGLQLPIAVHPTNIHPRMSAQKSCFTIHGKVKKSLNEIINPKHLTSFRLDQGKSKEMLLDLRMLGVSQSALFPDLDGLAKELKLTF